MNEEIKFLREHIKDICSYKGLQEELTYNVSLDILKRICIAFDYLQQENEELKKPINYYQYASKNLKDKNEQLKDNWNKLKEYFEENLYFYSGYQGEDREEDLSIKYALEKMNELEKGNNNEL